MKRSEALKIIESAIDNAIWVGARNMSSVHAEHLLHELETAGILPPSIRINTPLGPRIFFDTNEWEEDAKYDEEGYPIK